MPRQCFVICPIGEEGSDIRKRSDQLIEYVIKPSVEVLGYVPIRADEISEPGLITSQIIEHVVNDPLVVADLTGSNANVFYELALRHAVGEPLVQMIRMGEKIPFDVAHMRTVHYDLTDPASTEKARNDLAKQVRYLEGKKRGENGSPITGVIKKALRPRWPEDLIPLDQLVSMEQDAGNQLDHIRAACAHALWSLWPDRARHVLQNQQGDLRPYVALHARYLLDNGY